MNTTSEFNIVVFHKVSCMIDNNFTAEIDVDHLEQEDGKTKVFIDVAFP